MKTMIFLLSDYTKLVNAITESCGYEIGKITLKSFKDTETYIRIHSPVKDCRVIFIMSLEKPNDKFLSLLFAAATVKELGAKEIGLICPYLPYMRQDKRFNEGEAITSKYFATLLSQYFNWLITIDPHLHRYQHLNEIYSIQTGVLHAAETIALWITNHIDKPLLIGPDHESKQWVADIAKKIDAPFIVLEKLRKSDHQVEISCPDMESYPQYTPILVDDIIATAQTMIETVKHLKTLSKKPIICIGVHGIFVDNAYQDLLDAGASQVITCNTIIHPSNGINIYPIIIDWLKKYKVN